MNFSGSGETPVQQYACIYKSLLEVFCRTFAV